jgi:hypothetical protein
MTKQPTNLAPPMTNAENKGPRTAPNISFPVPKSEPNLPSAYIFPKDSNERDRETDQQAAGNSISEIGGITFSIP